MGAQISRGDNFIDTVRHLTRVQTDSHSLKDEKFIRKLHVIVSRMDKDKENLKVQQHCCNCLSNLCMNAEVAVYIVKRMKAHRLVLRAIRTFYDRDWRICWLGASAIWNMSRIDQCIPSFPARETINLLWSVSQKYDTIPCVVNTSFGCLSNLSLNTEYKRKVVSIVDVKKLFEIIDTHASHLPVATTCAGLFANLAVDDSIADSCTEQGVIKVISRMLDNDFEDHIFARNVVTALSNLMTSPLYRQECIRYKITEKIYVLKDKTASWAIISLMLNCLVTIGVPVTDETTSFHLASKFGLTKIFQEMISEEDEEIDFNMNDKMNTSLISYALRNPNANESMIRYLLVNGAEVDELEYELLNEALKNKVDRALALMNTVRNEHIEAVKNNTNMNRDLSAFIVQNLSNHALLGDNQLSEILKSSQL